MRRFVVAGLLATGLLSAAAVPASADGVFTVLPPGLGGASTATCVGPNTGTPADNGAWNAHFNGEASDGTSAVIHDFSC